MRTYLHECSDRVRTVAFYIVDIYRCMGTALYGKSDFISERRFCSFLLPNHAKVAFKLMKFIITSFLLVLYGVVSQKVTDLNRKS